MTTQFLSGAGSEVRPTGEREGTIYAKSIPGFMTFSVNEKKMMVHLLDHTGQILYTHELTK